MKLVTCMMRIFFPSRLLNVWMMMFVQELIAVIVPSVCLMFILSSALSLPFLMVRRSLPEACGCRLHNEDKFGIHRRLQVAVNTTQGFKAAAANILGKIGSSCTNIITIRRERNE